MLARAITIIQHPELGPAVSGRELYPLITNSHAARNVFSDWFRGKQAKFGFVEGKDFATTYILLPETGSNRSQIEFIISLPAAKILSKKAAAKR